MRENSEKHSKSRVQVEQRVYRTTIVFDKKFESTRKNAIYITRSVLLFLRARHLFFWCRFFYREVYLVCRDSSKEQEVLEKYHSEIHAFQFSGPAILEQTLGDFQCFQSARDVVIDPPAKQLLQWSEVFQSLENVESLSLNTSTLTPHSLEGIGKCQSLKDLYLFSDHLGDQKRSSTEILTDLSGCKSLEVLIIESFMLNKKTLQLISQLPIRKFTRPQAPASVSLSHFRHDSSFQNKQPSNSISLSLKSPSIRGDVSGVVNTEQTKP